MAPTPAGYGSIARAHMFFRGLVCPFDRLVQRIPGGARVLDLGCGHGLLFHALESSLKACRYTGLDLDPRKIRAAGDSLEPGQRERASFECRDLLSGSLPSADVITLFCVLYLLPDQDAPELLARCRESLEPGGKLLILETGTRPGWKYAWNLIHELFTVRVLGVTRGRSLRLRPASSYGEMLRQAGFRFGVEAMDQGYPYAYRLFEATMKQR